MKACLYTLLLLGVAGIGMFFFIPRAPIVSALKMDTGLPAQTGLVAVLGGGVKLSALAGAVHPYPTLGEINKKVVGSFFAEKRFSDKVKRGMKFFFNLKGRACP